MEYRDGRSLGCTAHESGAAFAQLNLTIPAGVLSTLVLPFDVEVTVTGARGNAFTLSTLRLGTVQ